MKVWQLPVGRLRQNERDRLKNIGANEENNADRAHPRVDIFNLHPSFHSLASVILYPPHSRLFNFARFVLANTYLPGNFASPHLYTTETMSPPYSENIQKADPVI
jgi:hypothetical protein